VLFIDGPSSPVHRHWLQSLCAEEPRCRWLEEDSVEPGIFGAMNQGFSMAQDGDWLLFWGSDDWAASPDVLASAISALEAAAHLPDLLICRGRYVGAASGKPGRPATFKPTALLSAAAYRRALLCGYSPPHQATLFGPGARQRFANYTAGFRLSADLDYFLKISRSPGLRVQCLDLELVYMTEGGISAQQTQRRLMEVIHAYRSAFGWSWWLPFVLRYARRLFSLLEQKG